MNRWLQRSIEVQNIINAIECEDYQFIVRDDGCITVKGFYYENDVNTGKSEVQWTRRWIIEDYATEDDIIRTVMKLLLTSHEHRVREHFLYKGERVFSPHKKVVE